MKKLIIASNNNHKISEIKEILKDEDFIIKSLKEEEIFIDVEEDGNTFEENSKKKALEIVKFLNIRGDKDFIVLADDSGLEVPFLKGEPGIYSARYAGEHGNDRANNIKLLDNLKGVNKDNRAAQFICHISLINEKEEYLGIRGSVKGSILDYLPDKEGFGYDPIFFYEPLKKTFLELKGEEKNKISHRGVALQKLKMEIKKFI